MECQSRSDFYQARLLCVRYEAQKCLLFHCLPKSPHPQCPFRAGKASGAHFVPPGKRGVTRFSITDLRVTGEDAAVRTRAAAFTHRGNPVKWPPGCSHMGRLLHDIWIFSCVCSRLELKKKSAVWTEKKLLGSLREYWTVIEDNCVC